MVCSSKATISKAFDFALYLSLDSYYYLGTHLIKIRDLLWSVVVASRGHPLAIQMTLTDRDSNPC